MSLQRWWSVILTMGLFMALSPLGAQAGPNRPFTPPPNRQAFTPPQPRGNAAGWNGQNRQWNQPRGNAYGWNNQHRQWQQPRGNAYGWNGHHRQWQHHRGNAYGWNGPQHQGNQPRNAYGGNDHQRQWQQPHPSAARGDRPGNRQFQPVNGGQHHNPGSPDNRAGYPAQTQSPNIVPSSSGSSHNTTIPAGQFGAQSGFHRPDASGNAPRTQGQPPSGVI